MNRDPGPSWRRVVVAVNPHVSLTLGELVDGWEAHVQRLAAELGAESGDRTTWGAHDYLATLTIRESIALGLSLVQEGERTHVIGQVAVTDREFEEFTEPDRRELLRTLLPSDLRHKSWWWHRVPKGGPVRYDLEQGYE